MVNRFNEHMKVRIALACVVFVAMVYVMPELDRWLYPCDYLPCWPWFYGGPR